jgi:hypothetical protein
LDEDGVYGLDGGHFNSCFKKYRTSDDIELDCDHSL